MDYLSAEEYCKNTYDSHLGTMLTDDDWSLAYNYSYYSGFNGLNDIDEDNQWSWIDGTQCTGTKNDGSCSDRFELPDSPNNEFCSKIPWGGWKAEPYPCDAEFTQFYCNKGNIIYIIYIQISNMQKHINP